MTYHEKVDFVAISMCQAMGLDPLLKADGVSKIHTMTRCEVAAVQANPDADQNIGRLVDAKLWQCYRRDAELFVAGDHAISELRRNLVDPFRRSAHDLLAAADQRKAGA